MNNGYSERNFCAAASKLVSSVFVAFWYTFEAWLFFKIAIHIKKVLWCLVITTITYIILYKDLSFNVARCYQAKKLLLPITSENRETEK